MLGTKSPHYQPQNGFDGLSMHWGFYSFYGFLNLEISNLSMTMLKQCQQFLRSRFKTFNTPMFGWNMFNGRVATVQSLQRRWIHQINSYWLYYFLDVRKGGWSNWSTFWQRGTYVGGLFGFVDHSLWSSYKFFWLNMNKLNHFFWRASRAGNLLLISSGFFCTQLECSTTLWALDRTGYECFYWKPYWLLVSAASSNLDATLRTEVENAYESTMKKAKKVL